MSEQVNEQKVPSKEEVLAFLMEQIEVKKVQMELQEINMKLAQYRAEELKALSFIGQITNPQPPADAEPHTITQEDMDANPELSEQGFKVGDEVLVEKQQPSKQRGLKKDK
jgi:cupin superfamily acireductone dioxygenase involved in methionine salvage